MKRKLSYVLSVLVLALAVTGCNATFSDAKNESFCTEGLVIQDGAVIGYDGDDETVIIPSVYEGKTVYKIEKKALSGKDIKNLYIPDTVRIIGEDAVSGCKELGNIRMSENTEQIGKSAFDNTVWWEKQHDGPVYIGKTLYSCKGNPKAGNVTVRDGTVSVSERAFYGNENIVSIDIPDSVVRIGGMAFMNCTNLEKIYGAVNVVFCGEKTVINTKFASLKSEGPVYLGNTVVDYVITPRTEGAIYIDEDCVAVADSAFENMFTASDETVIIRLNDKLSHIGKNAFGNCSSLSVINLENVGYIEESAFYNCGIDTVNLGSNLGYLGENCFKNCSLLTFFNCADSKISEIPANAFSGTNLKSVVLPKTVESVGDYAFENCVKLRRFDAGGSELSSIGNSAFKNCVSLASITIPHTLSEIKPYAFNNCTSLNSADFSESTGLKAVGEGCFWGCLKLEEISFSDTFEVIPPFCFYGCSSLSTVKAPNVEEISEYAFAECKSLNLMFGNTLALIGDGSFENSAGRIRFNGDIPAVTGKGSFGEEIVISVPSELLAVYKNAWNLMNITGDDE